MRLTQLNNIRPMSVSSIAMNYFIMAFVTIPLTAIVFLLFTTPLFLISKYKDYLRRTS